MKLDGRISRPRRPKATTVPEPIETAGPVSEFISEQRGPSTSERTVIGYLDTSAFVPIMLVAEPTSAACLDFWLTADAVVSSRLVYVETASVLARSERGGRSHRRPAPDVPAT